MKGLFKLGTLLLSLAGVIIGLHSLSSCAPNTAGNLFSGEQLFPDKPTRVLRNQGGPVFGLAWNPDGKFLAAPIFENKSVQIWNVETGSINMVLQPNRDYVSSISWSPDGRQIAVTGNYTVVKFWDAEKGVEKAQIDTGTNTVIAVAWSPSDKYLATASKDSTIKIWNIPSLQQAYLFSGHSKPVDTLAWSPGGQRLASGSADSIRIWDIEPGSEERALDKNASGSLAWNPSGEWLATGGTTFWEKKILPRIWDPTNGKEVRVLEPAPSFGIGRSPSFPGAIHQIAWSPDGQYVAMACNDGTVRLVNARTGKVVQILHHNSYVEVLSVAWSPDGLYLASSDFNGAILLWKLLVR